MPVHGLRHHGAWENRRAGHALEFDNNKKTCLEQVKEIYEILALARRDGGKPSMILDSRKMCSDLLDLILHDIETTEIELNLHGPDFPGHMEGENSCKNCDKDSSRDMRHHDEEQLNVQSEDLHSRSLSETVKKQQKLQEEMNKRRKRIQLGQQADLLAMFEGRKLEAETKPARAEEPFPHQDQKQGQVGAKIPGYVYIRARAQTQAQAQTQPHPQCDVRRPLPRAGTIASTNANNVRFYTSYPVMSLADRKPVQLLLTATQLCYMPLEKNVGQSLIQK